MIFALGFTIAIGVALCVPSIWSAVVAFWGRKNLYNSEPVKDNDNSPKEQDTPIQEPCENCVTLTNEILELKSQPPQTVEVPVEKVVEKEIIKEVPVEKIVEVPVYGPAEDPRLEPIVDDLLEHLRTIPDPGDRAAWRKDYFDIVHKIYAIRGHDRTVEEIEEVEKNLPTEPVYTPVV